MGQLLLTRPTLLWQLLLTRPALLKQLLLTQPALLRMLLLTRPALLRMLLLARPALLRMPHLVVGCVVLVNCRLRGTTVLWAESTSADACEYINTVSCFWSRRSFRRGQQRRQRRGIYRGEAGKIKLRVNLDATYRYDLFDSVSQQK